MSKSNQGCGSFVPMDTDNDEISQVPSTSSTDTQIARSGRATPTGLPPGTFARGEMRRKACQQRAVEEQNAVQAMVRRLERIDRVLSLYDQTLTTSQDADHLALNALPPTIRQLVTQLVETEASSEQEPELSVSGYTASTVGSYKSKQPPKCCKKPSEILAKYWTTNRRQARTYTRQSKRKVQKHDSEKS